MKLILSLLAGLGSTAALNEIIIKGSKFFDSVTGDQFYMNGIAYQPAAKGKYDTLAVPNFCKRDIPYLKKLKINTLRVYEKFGIHNHDDCMRMLEEAGIYVVIDLPVSFLSIDRSNPSYDTEIFNLYKETIDAFGKYPNTLAFIAGNEVTNDIKTTAASAYVKAALRDAKAYLKKNYRVIPVGYADNDDPVIRKNIQSYFDCGDESARADFYAINIYRWCGDVTFKEAGYEEIRDELKNLNVPTFLSEYGCNKVSPRPFKEIGSIFGSDMNEVISGGILYEFTQEANEYGIVKIVKEQVKVMPDYENAREILSKIEPVKLNMKDYNPNKGQKSCPAVGDDWKSGKKLPPTPSEEACECIYESLSCRVTDKAKDPENGQSVGELVGHQCGFGLCDDIIADAEKGVYGAYSGCPSHIKNSIVFDAAAKKGNSCDFDGFASSSNSKKSSSQCQSLQASFSPQPARSYPMDTTPDKLADSKKYQYPDVNSVPDTSSPDATHHGGDDDDHSHAHPNFLPSLWLGLGMIVVVALQL